MIDNYTKLIEGRVLNGEHFQLSRARSIYDVARYQYPYVTDIECCRNNNCDEIIKLKLCRLEVPDQPIFSIHEEEEIAIICHPEDISLPEVYALRNDFPLELPHSNARPFIRPVSLCVSDVDFADIRSQFNAFDFLNSIRRWFSLNSINKLHEADRPLDLYFLPREVCCLLNIPDRNNPYVKYAQVSTQKSNISTSTLEFVDKSKVRPTHYLLHLPVVQVYASNFIRIPKTMGDLKLIKSSDHSTLLDDFVKVLPRKITGLDNLQLLVMISIIQNTEKEEAKSKELFLIKIENTTINDIISKQRRSEKDFYIWINELPVNLAFVYIMVSRNSNAIYNGTSRYFSKVSILGAGTLGSAVIDHFVREGIAEEIAIADFDILYPHNLSRHTMAIDKVMKTKLQAIKETYDGILGQRITIIEKNALFMTEYEERSLIKKTQLIMDFSTSIAVERRLANSNNSYRCCTSFLNPKANEIVLMIEDKERSCRLDLLEMDYYRNLIVDNRFSNHLEQGRSVRTNNFSCRAESTILNYENVRILSAIISRQIKKHYEEDECYLGIWHVDTDRGTVESNPMRISSWRLLSKDAICSVWISSAIEEEICQMVVDSSVSETGGCLFGNYDKDYNKIYIYYMIPAPTDSIHSPVSFVRGFNGLTDDYERITKLTYHQVRYLGEWHSHPNMSKSPSSVDDQQFSELSEEQKSQDLPFVQIIHGNDGLFARARM